ncbi:MULTISPECIES: hypothetical protein [unclassified Micromonospora]|uniref:hypothetical protein n=1 Tax=unclassified Micromonospora TaxID=2617518 RepID=UPI002FF1DF55
MRKLYARPNKATELEVRPELASWDAAGRPSQERLARFLDHVASIAEPVMTAVDGPVAVELVVGVPDPLPLTAGGRDLDNYLYPVAQRLGAKRIGAVFGRKVRGGSSSLAVGPAVPQAVTMGPQFATRVAGSYASKLWKQTLRERLLAAQAAPASSGPVRMQIAVTTGSGRNWANLWKPLLDSFGPVLGEDPLQSFHPYDDRIVDLGLHHVVDAELGHDVLVEAWWGEPTYDPNLLTDYSSRADRRPST